MNKLYIIEISQQTMQELYNIAPAGCFFICKIDDRKSINQFLNEQFGTIHRQYDYFLHEFSMEEIQENHLIKISQYFGFNDLLSESEVE